MVGVLGVSGALLGRVANPVWAAMRAREPGLRLASAGRAAGQGTTLALLGGFRALVADFAWLRLFVLWERRDLGGVDTLVHLVPALDPRPVCFWTNGARMLAYDLPVWRIEAAGGFAAVPPAAQQEIAAAQAHAALHLLEEARAFHPADPDLWVEEANLRLNKLGDLAGAAECYRRAWELPGGPYYAARLHAEMLRRAGRPHEALDWLVQLHPKLPPDEEAAAADVVLGRIRELERQLQVPPARAYRPAVR